MAEMTTMQRPKRWDKPFGPDMTAEDVERAKTLPLVEMISKASFPESMSLEDILLNDARILRVKKGDIVIREGDYGSSVFFILEGSVRIVLDPKGEQVIAGGKAVRKRSVFGALSQLWKNPRTPEARDVARYVAQRGVGLRDDVDGEARTFVDDPDGFVRDYETVPLPQGQMFGEMAAMSRTPRTVSVFADTDCDLLEMRWQGLREVRKRSTEFREYTDQLYRARGVHVHLADAPMFTFDQLEATLREELLADVHENDPAKRKHLTEKLRADFWKDIAVSKKMDRKPLESLTSEQLATIIGDLGSVPRSLVDYRLGEALRKKIADATGFESYGEFEWFGSFKRVRGTHEVIEQEPIIAEQGHYADGLIMIRAGFARVSTTLGQGWRTVGYLTQNEVFGLEELVSQWRDGSEPVLRHRLSAVGFVDILRVPTAMVEKYVLPNVPASALPEPAPLSGVEAMSLLERDGSEMRQSMVNFLVDHRIINGTATMMINTDRCVGCDDCVRACAANHDNNPRFVRHGVEHLNVMVANACMHCGDPVCLIGCPTGAIHRDREYGNVVIDDNICIGCSTCANSCPYSNIRMVEIRDRSGAFIMDAESGAPIQKATKCDLCLGQLGGPACQRACPHDALIRIDMRDRDQLAEWMAGR